MGICNCTNKFARPLLHCVTLSPPIKLNISRTNMSKNTKRKFHDQPVSPISVWETHSKDAPSAISVIQKGELVLCQLTEDGNFEPFLFSSNDVDELAKAFGDGCEARPIPNALIFSFGEWFNYDYKEVADPFSPDGVWLAPNRHTACRDIDTLIMELQATANKWEAIQRIIEKPSDARERSISKAMGKELKQDFSGLVRNLRRFMNYEVVEA